MSSFNALFVLMRNAIYLNRKLILWLTIGFGLLFLFTANTGAAFSPLYNIALFVGGGLVSISAFKDLHDTNFNVQYLTLPVAAWVRYLSGWLLTGPLYLAFLTALYELAILAHVLGGTYWGIDDPNFLVVTLWRYLMFNAFCLFGSVYFKKLPLVKTLISLLIITVVLLLLRDAIVNMGWWQLSEWLRAGTWSVLAILAWCAAYANLKRVELK